MSGGRKPRPLKREEVNQEVAASFDFDSQELRSRKDGYQALHIRRVCLNCDVEFWSVASQIRSDIKRGRRVTGFCRPCAKTPGEHQRGFRNDRVKDGYINFSGYRVLYRPNHSTADSSGYIPEHRYLMSEHLGRPLEDGEQVHHINGVRDDNRIENLELRKTAHGPGVEYECLDCGSDNVKSMSLGV